MTVYMVSCFSPFILVWIGIAGVLVRPNWSVCSRFGRNQIPRGRLDIWTCSGLFRPEQSVYHIRVENPGERYGKAHFRLILHIRRNGITDSSLSAGIDITIS
jgi:hypothetical protein